MEVRVICNPYNYGEIFSRIKAAISRKTLDGFQVRSALPDQDGNNTTSGVFCASLGVLFQHSVRVNAVIRQHKIKQKLAMTWSQSIKSTHAHRYARALNVTSRTQDLHILHIWDAFKYISNQKQNETASCGYERALNRVHIGQMDNYFPEKFSGVVNCSFACLDKNSVSLALEFTWARTIPLCQHKSYLCFPVWPPIWNPI
jgi:hypothetical protein